DLSEADVRQEVDGDLRLLDRGEVASEVAPRPPSARLLRRRRSALADDFGRHALPDLALGVAVREQREVRVRVRIDEARSEHAAGRVDGARGGPVDAPDRGDASVPYPDGAGHGRRAGPVDDAR